ncbi:MAG: tetratricopeptide repeat protein [Desulfobaccales bacterium]
MLKPIPLCVWIMIAALTATPGWAGKKSEAPPAAAPAQDISNPEQAGEGGEAAELIRQTRELMKAGKFEEALPLARQALEIREKKLGPDHPGTAGSLMLVGRIEDAQFRFYKALPLYQRALKIREKTLGPDNPDTAASMALLARIYAILGFFDKGLPLAQQALKIREKALGPDNPQTALSLMILGFLYGQMGDHDKALLLTQQSLRISEKALGPNDPQTATALDNLAQLYSRQGLYDQALPLAQRAARIREQTLGLEHRRTAMALKFLGFLYLAKKDYGQAEACFRRAAHQQGEQGMVELYLATGRYEAALDTLSRIAPAAWTRPQYQAQFYTQKGLALKGLGRRQEAYTAFTEAIGTIEELRARTPGARTSFFETGILSGYFQAYRGMVEVLAEMAQKGDALPAPGQTYGPDPGAAAFYFAESIKARSLLEAMAAGASRVSDPIAPDLAAKENSLRERLETLEAQREEKLQERGKGWDRKEQPVQEFKLKIAALQKEQQQLVEEMRRRNPRYAALRYPQPYKAQELPLKPGEVLLEYALGDKESFIFRVEPGCKVQVFRLPLGQEALEKRLAVVLAPFRQSVLRREDLTRFSLSEAAGLYGELLAPALAGVAPGTHLIIVPDGALGAFPFEALVVEAKGDWGKSVLVGDRWPVTYSQSAAILALNRHLATSRASQALFALGDCIYDKGSSRYQAYKAHQGQAGELRHAGPEKVLTMSATGVRGVQLQFPPLPETRKTVEDLAALFGEAPRPPQVLLDVEATETRVRQTHLEQYRYLFFGTHGFLADNLAGVQEPTLVLTQVENKSPDNGFLSFSKVLQLKLDADLVTLAACMTGAGQIMQGEGVLNFARAFQQAGARSVMVTLWNIPVEESLTFYHTFYQGVKSGKTRLQALQAARKSVRDKEPHPYFWSGIILHGEG